jgi:hypothetical protein
MSTLVLIPAYLPRPEPLEAAFVRNNVRVLAQREGAFVLPQRLDAAPYLELAPHFRVERFPDHYFASIRGYNRLMLSPRFYERWRGVEHILLCQTDALVLHGDLEPFESAPCDYIGAVLPPHIVLPRYYFPGAGRLMRMLPLLVAGVQPRVGNGGLSLRRVAALHDLLLRERWRVRLWRLNEDLYFSTRGCDPDSGFVVASEALAQRFCVETEGADSVRDPARRPFGMHKPQAYARKALMELLNECGEPEAAALLATPP